MLVCGFEDIQPASQGIHRNLSVYEADLERIQAKMKTDESLGIHTVKAHTENMKLSKIISQNGTCSGNSLSTTYLVLRLCLDAGVTLSWINVSEGMSWLEVGPVRRSTPIITEGLVRAAWGLPASFGRSRSAPGEASVVSVSATPIKPDEAGARARATDAVASCPRSIAPMTSLTTASMRVLVSEANAHAPPTVTPPNTVLTTESTAPSSSSEHPAGPANKQDEGKKANKGKDHHRNQLRKV